MKRLVMKFGGASVAKSKNFLQIAKIIEERSKNYPSIVAVLSAMGDTTDQLLSLAKKVNPNPPKREVDMLISTGERVSISLLAMALARLGHEAISFTGSQSGIITCARHSDAKIIDVRPNRILPHLEEGKVVIVAGFQGVGLNGEITTLGRGGSDTSAVALATALGAKKVEFYKDVSGIYEKDPKLTPDSKFFSSLEYDEALEIAKKGNILHPRCIEMAKRNHVLLHVLSYKENQDYTSVEGLGTKIGSEETTSSHIYELEAEEEAIREGICI